MERQNLFNALTTSARQLFLLLRCISFAAKVDVQITPQGLRFSAEESRAVQGVAFLEKKLFSSFKLQHDGEGGPPTFQVSLPALLETLQIFGMSEAGSSGRNLQGGFSSSYATAFNTPALGIGGTCRLSYPQIGSPLSITISEASLTTSCDLTTYELPATYAEDDSGIPFDRNGVVLKVIMRSTWLYDAVGELSGTNPTTLEVSASNLSAPYFVLSGQDGPFGDSTVDFTPDGKEDDRLPSNHARGKKQPCVTESFQVAAPPGNHGRVKQRYKFDLIKKAARAMLAASKVSLRMDRQGVLSLQLMIEVGETAGTVAREATHIAPNGGNGAPAGISQFVDFRFVPLLDEDDEGTDDNDGDLERSEGSEA